MSDLKVNTKGLEDFEKKIKQLDRDAFFIAASKELAGRLLAMVTKRTPVGVYPHETGGTLRRGWVHHLVVTKRALSYKIDILNPVEYASYVEYGHRTANGNGWVEGQFMLTISEEELRGQSKQILERKLDAWLRKVVQ